MLANPGIVIRSELDIASDIAAGRFADRRNEMSRTLISPQR